MVNFVSQADFFFHIFNCVDPNPYLEYGSTKLQNTVIAPNFDTIFTQNIFFCLFSLGDPPIKIHECMSKMSKAKIMAFEWQGC